MPFKVTQFPRVKAQILTVMKRAAALDISHICIDALERIQHHLETRPLDWGDPDFNLVHAGGIACHGIEVPFLVRFSVYEAENAVCVFDIQTLPPFPLAE